MKKTAVLVILALIAGLFGGCGKPVGKDTSNMKVALITDYADIDDHSWNQAAYEGARGWCEENRVDFKTYRPGHDSTVDRVSAMEQAIAEGHNVLLLPGYPFANAIVETVEKYPEVRFISMDVTELDLQEAAHPSIDPGAELSRGWKYPANLYAAVYREELAGYLAGFAAVKLGYTRLGFLGGLSVPPVVRYGYGYVQGVNDAAAELGKQSEIELRYIYNNTFCPEDSIAEAAEWYEEGIELIFACGESVYREVAEAAEKTGGRLICTDTDLAPLIDAQYGAGMTVCAAMKGFDATVRTQLERIAAGSFEGGKVEKLGIVSENPKENYVQLPDSTQWNEGFDRKAYEKLVGELLSEARSVSDSIDKEPTVGINVDYRGNITRTNR